MRAERRLRGLPLLHELQLAVLQLGLAPGERRHLVLQRLELASRARTGVQPGPVLLRPGAHLLDVLLQTGDVAIDVVDRDLGPHALVVEIRNVPRDRIQRGLLRQRRLLVRQLRQCGVDGLQIEQAPLRLGCCLHAACSFELVAELADGVARLLVHGSVSRSRHGSCRVRCPVADRGRRRPTSSSHGRSVAQCAASINAGPPPAMCSLAGWWRRSAVRYASTPARSASARKLSPGPAADRHRGDRRGPGHRSRGRRGGGGQHAPPRVRDERTAVSVASGSRPIRPAPRPATVGRLGRPQRAQIDQAEPPGQRVGHTRDSRGRRWCARRTARCRS